MTEIVIQNAPTRLSIDETDQVLSITADRTQIVIAGDTILQIDGPIFNEVTIANTNLSEIVKVIKDIQLVELGVQGPAGQAGTIINPADPFIAQRFISRGPFTATIGRNPDNSIATVAFTGAETVTINRDGNGVITSVTDGTVTKTINRDGNGDILSVVAA